MSKEFVAKYMYACIYIWKVLLDECQIVILNFVVTVEFVSFLKFIISCDFSF